MKYMDSQNVLFQHQYGFRKGHGAIQPIIHLLNRISIANEKKLGIRGVARAWLENYLRNRQQYMVLDGVKSVTKSITCGVPQGSIQLSLNVKKTKYILFGPNRANTVRQCRDLDILIAAEDTTVYIAGDNQQALYDQVNTDLKNLTDWFRSNQLSVNPSKTKYILFSRNAQSMPFIPEMFLHIDNEHLERVNSTKSLGIHIDSHLTWEDHIEHCRSKLSSGIYTINMSKHLLNKNHLII